MSLHWTLIAGFLYFEIGVILLLLLPLISPKRWNRVFKSRFLKSMENQLIYYFYVLVTILILFFLDALREVRKYGDEHDFSEQSHTGHLDAKMQTTMRLFRAQRNFYISGFALFLCLVIKRLVSLISSNAILDAEKEAAMNQAKSASRAAETLMKDGGSAQDSEVEKKLKKTEEALKEARADVESMKTQAANVSAEYDRLLEEKDRLERKVKVLGGADAGDKKDD